MKRLTAFLAGMFVGSALATVSLKYHIVRASDGHHWIRKTDAQFSGAYVDIREFGLEQWQERPALAVAISRSGNQDLLNEAARQSVRQSVRDWLE